jgi:hypothetical protein
MIGTILSSELNRRLVILALAATLAGMLIIAVFTPTGAAQATKTPNVEKGYSDLQGGMGEKERMGEEFLPFPSPSQGVPLLKSFFFHYARCAKYLPGTNNPEPSCLSGVDNHLGTMLIAPNSPTQNEIHLTFADQNFADLIYYDVQHYIVTDPRITTEVVGDVGFGHTTKTISRRPPAGNYVFVLRGFQLNFTGARDNHINEVGIMADAVPQNPNKLKLNIFFHDKDYKDGFVYKVWYAWVPKDLFLTADSWSGTGATGAAHRAGIPPGPGVIRGFSFDSAPYGDRPALPGKPPIPGADHHIAGIEVQNHGGRLEVGYADKSSNDQFAWTFRYGILK